MLHCRSIVAWASSLYLGRPFAQRQPASAFLRVIRKRTNFGCGRALCFSVFSLRGPWTDGFDLRVLCLCRRGRDSDLRVRIWRT